MDLIGKPWLPVVDGRGDTRLVGLEGLFRESTTLRDLALRPAQRVAVTRLLIAVTYRSLDGPADGNEWACCRDQIVPKALSYLDSHRNEFQLFGNRPFLQAPGLKQTDNATVDKLDFTLASGNMDTLYDHSGGSPRALLPSSVALHLLTYQSFSPGGLQGDATWNGNAIPRHGDAAPAIDRSPLHTVLRGSSLLDLIHLNLVPVDLLPGPLGDPVWEHKEIPGPNCEAADSLCRSVLGQLVPLSRAILLNSNCQSMTVTTGLKYPKVGEGGRELAATVVRKQGKQQKHAYLRIDLAKHPWRELASVLTLSKADGPGGPLALQNLHRQCWSKPVDVWVGGLVVYQARFIDEAEWVLAVPMDLIDEIPLALYQSGAGHANLGAGSLDAAVKAYAQAFSKTKSSANSQTDLAGLRREAKYRYWSNLDQQYPLLLEIAEAGGRLTRWHKLLKSAMHRVYREACPHTTPRQIQAFVEGQRRLSLHGIQDDQPITEETTV